MQAEAEEVEQKLSSLNQDDLNQTMYATDKLGAWLALCLVANEQVIFVPTSVFPESANTDYLASKLIEAARQNPICGTLSTLAYSPDYESLIVEYEQSQDDNISKANAELNEAKRVAGTISGSSD